MKPIHRREFIGDSTKIGVAAMLGLPLLSSFTEFTNNTSPIFVPPHLKTGFDQQPLGYAYNSLEPNIDAQTMEIHYTKHASAYSKNAKEAAAAEGVDVSKPVEDVLGKISKYTPKMRNNAGGHFNHELFWKCMAPGGNAAPTGKLLKAIEQNFGSLDKMKTQFSDAAKTRFGSGWAWLVLTGDKKLAIGSTPNQDNPLMDIAELKGLPLLGLDVWEHAYYLKYQNRRPEYVENFWKVVNWNFVAERFESM
jgi:Fe-Mn family superoxide dismutase